MSAVSLRMLAREVGVAPNAIYTYFPSMVDVWSAVREWQLSYLGPFTVDAPCGRCQLRDWFDCVLRHPHVDALLELYCLQAKIGPQSFALSESILAYTEDSPLPAHLARNLVLIWLLGRVTLLRTKSLEPERREQMRIATGLDFPREAAANQESTERDREMEVTALLNSLELPCRCGKDADAPKFSASKAA